MVNLFFHQKKAPSKENRDQIAPCVIFITFPEMKTSMPMDKIEYLIDRAHRGVITADG